MGVDVFGKEAFISSRVMRVVFIFFVLALLICSAEGARDSWDRSGSGH